MAASRRFSSSAKTLWAVAGVAAAALVAVFVADALWERAPTEREVVAAYIEEVNAAQRSFIVPLDRVNATYASLQVGPGDDPSQVEELREAEQVIRAVRVRVAALTPPPKAVALQRELLEALDLQIAFAHDVTELARFLPQLAREDTARGQATVRLRRELQDASTPAQQVAAFARFGKALDATAGRLNALAAPPWYARALEAEVARTKRLRSLSTQLRRAIENRRAEDAERIFLELAETVRAGATPQSREALRSFARRSRELGRQRLAVDRERARLNGTLR